MRASSRASGETSEASSSDPDAPVPAKPIEDQCQDGASASDSEPSSRTSSASPGRRSTPASATGAAGSPRPARSPAPRPAARRRRQAARRSGRARDPAPTDRKRPRRQEVEAVRRVEDHGIASRCRHGRQGGLCDNWSGEKRKRGRKEAAGEVGAAKRHAGRRKSVSPFPHADERISRDQPEAVLPQRGKVPLTEADVPTVGPGAVECRAPRSIASSHEPYLAESRGERERHAANLVGAHAGTILDAPRDGACPADESRLRRPFDLSHSLLCRP